jgi:esterase
MIFFAEYEPLLPVRQFLLKNLYRKEEGGFALRFNLPLLTRDMAKVGAAVISTKPVEVPVLFMRGDKSDYILDEDWEEILKIFPNAKLVTIENSGHWVQAEQPKVFVENLLNFVA